MLALIVNGLVGILCIVIGIFNTQGNVSMLHSYHRNRVSPENLLPFGRLVGAGMIIIGVSIILMGAFIFITERTANTLYEFIGMIIMGVGLIGGTALAFYAMKKYNKGIF